MTDPDQEPKTDSNTTAEVAVKWTTMDWTPAEELVEPSLDFILLPRKSRKRRRFEKKEKKTQDWSLKMKGMGKKK